MKKTLGYVILSTLVASAMAVVGCKSTKQVEIEEENDQTVMFAEIKNFSVFSHSFLDNTYVGETLTITGTLLKTEGGYVLMENYSSKSRVSFALNCDLSDEKIVEELNSHLDQVITVEGVLVDASKTWSKEMVYKRIVE